MRSTGDGCQLDNIEASAEPCTELKDLRIRHMQDTCLSHSLGIVRTRPSRNFFHWETNEQDVLSSRVETAALCSPDAKDHRTYGDKLPQTPFGSKWGRGAAVDTRVLWLCLWFRTRTRLMPPTAKKECVRVLKPKGRVSRRFEEGG